LTPEVSVTTTANPQTRVQERRRPADLAREHGLSAQAVRNYEREGVLPPAARTPAGYRVYTAVHAAALRAYLAVVAGHGYAAAREILRAANRGDLGTALRLVDDGHAQLARDRGTLAAVEASIGVLTAAAPASAVPGRPGRPLAVGELAHRLGVKPATLRAWERAGILRPARDPHSGRRGYDATDVRDAELAHLLRRGGHGLRHIAAVVDQVRSAGGTAELAALLTGWQARLTARGLAMLRAAGELSAYLGVPSGQDVDLARVDAGETG
jgi:DNA-binding transcriptional MerR regulator